MLSFQLARYLGHCQGIQFLASYHLVLYNLFANNISIEDALILSYTSMRSNTSHISGTVALSICGVRSSSIGSHIFDLHAKARCILPILCHFENSLLFAPGLFLLILYRLQGMMVMPVKCTLQGRSTAEPVTSVPMECHTIQILTQNVVKSISLSKIG